METKKIIYERNCPNCNKIVQHINKDSYNISLKNNSLCRSCAQIGKSAGEKNPRYGKSLYGMWVEKYGEDIAKEKEKIRLEKYKNTVENRSEEKKKKVSENISKSTSGKNNPMYGKSLSEEHKKKISKTRIRRGCGIGEKNPMYGKPSPKGSGNGWSGWYNNKYFRSLKELSFMIFLDKENISYKSAEGIKIKYIYRDVERTYCADFIVDNKYMIEIKPLNLQYSNIVLAKQKCAIEYCNKNNLIYYLFDFKIINLEEICELESSGIIKFIDRYKLKFNNWKKEYGIY